MDRQNVQEDEFTIALEIFKQNGDNGSYSLVGTIIEEEIDFYDGETKIIIEFQGEEKLYFINVSTKSEIDTLLATQNEDYYYGSVLDDYQCQIWISFGDGRVVSPHLNPSFGNIYYGELFNYVPEKPLSASFKRLFINLNNER